MASTERSLVLGFAAGLSAEAFRPFAVSLRATGFRGRFGLITAKCTPEQRAELAELADLHWDVDDRYRAAVSGAELAGLAWMRRTPRVRRLYPAAFQALATRPPRHTAQARWERMEYALEGLQALRYGLYHEFLTTVAPDADVVLLSDLRDVLFQADPFERPVDGLELYLEDPCSTIGSDPFNSAWIRHLYGRQRLAELAERRTSCSGTTVGDRDAVLHYLHAMAQDIGWRRRPLGSHDQGVHNGLLNAGRFPTARLVPNGSGRVLTMGLMAAVEVDPDGLVRNEDGTVPAVLHQYDRHPQLARELLGRLAGVDGSACAST